MNPEMMLAQAKAYEAGNGQVCAAVENDNNCTSSMAQRSLCRLPAQTTCPQQLQLQSVDLQTCTILY
jgi:hypothetical protein